MRLVFCGTPEFAARTLQAVLDAGHQVPLVLTQPDRPAGRKLELQAPPVKRLALERGLEVLQPERIKRNEELRQRLEAIAPDAILIVAYGRIIPDWMLALPRFGNLNLHGSLLPKYRGAAPIQWAVARGESETGVTTMRLDAGLDTGEVLLEQRVPVGPATTAAELYPVLADVGAKLMLRTLQGLEAGSLKGVPQDHSRATLAPLLRREDGRLELERRTAEEAYNRWRGFYPWPGAWSELRGQRLLVHRMRPWVQEAAAGLEPGELRVEQGVLLAGAAQGTMLALEEVQREGKPRLPGAVFARDFQLRAGERLG